MTTGNFINLRRCFCALLVATSVALASSPSQAQDEHLSYGEWLNSELTADIDNARFVLEPYGVRFDVHRDLNWRGRLKDISASYVGTIAGKDRSIHALTIEWGGRKNPEAFLFKAPTVPGLPAEIQLELFKWGSTRYFGNTEPADGSWSIIGGFYSTDGDDVSPELAAGRIKERGRSYGLFSGAFVARAP